MAEWIDMLNPPNVKNIKQDKYSGTRGSYANKLHHFHVWLMEKEFTFTRLIRTGKNSFDERTEKIKLEGVVHFLKLYQERGTDSTDFKKIIKQFLHDPKHGNNFKSTMNQSACTIKSFFKTHYSAIDISYNKNKFKENDKEDEDNEPSMTLEEFLLILTVGKPSILKKSVFMSKFHGGMDSLTLADRFNFNAYPQIVKYFGTENYMVWDLSLCPVPINIVRPKTNVRSLIMQDYDAIVCLQAWLKDRERITGHKINITDPIFINQRGNPISSHWIKDSFFDLADEAGLQEKVKGYDKTYKKKSHLVRDLLESALVDCGVPDYVAEQFISHAPISKYQNRKKLFPEGLREEYMKGSKKINIFSKISQSLSETVSNDELKQKIKKLEEKNIVIHHLQEKKLVEKEQSEHETKRLEQVLANQGEVIKSMQEQMSKMAESMKNKEQ